MKSKVGGAPSTPDKMTKVLDATTKIHITSDNSYAKKDRDEESTVVVDHVLKKPKVVIPRFKLISPVKYGKDQSGIRRSERILERTDEDATRPRIFTRLRPRATLSPNKYLPSMVSSIKSSDAAKNSYASNSYALDDADAEGEDCEGDDADGLEADDDDDDEEEDSDDKEEEDDSEDESEAVSSLEEENRSRAAVVKRSTSAPQPKRSLRSTSDSTPLQELKASSRVKRPRMVREEEEQVSHRPITISISSFDLAERREIEKIASSFRLAVASEFSDECSYVIVPHPVGRAKRVRRTLKVLAGLAQGVPILSEKWLEACQKKRSLVDTHHYEMNQAFPGYAIRKSKGVGILESFRLFVLKGTNPAAGDIETLVRFAGGRLVNKLNHAELCIGPEQSYYKIKRCHPDIHFLADSSFLDCLHFGTLPRQMDRMRRNTSLTSLSSSS